MIKPNPIVIRKMAHRRLYVPGAGHFVTLKDISAMIRRGDEVVIYNAKTDEDITHAILTQIIVEHEKDNEILLPITFLRQLIRWHGDEMQALMGSYLEVSVKAFSYDKEQFLAQPFGKRLSSSKRIPSLIWQLLNAC